MASSSSSSQHESLLARSCSSLPSIDALVAQLVALHRAQEGDIDDNNNLEGGAAGAGYTLTAKKKVADNYCRWLRYAVTESSPGAIKSLLRLLPYPPEEEATQAAEDDEARKVVKLLLANKLMSILTDAFDAMVNTLPQSEKDLYLWRHEHRDVELTPSPAIVLENILGSLDELCLIHPTGVNVAPFLTRCVKLLVTCRNGDNCDDDEEEEDDDTKRHTPTTLHLRRCIVGTLVRLLQVKGGPKHASVLRGASPSVWQLFDVTRCDDLQYVRLLIDLFANLAPTAEEAAKCWTACSDDFRGSVESVVTKDFSASQPRDELHEREHTTLHLAYAFNNDEVSDGNEVFVDSCEVNSTKFLSSLGVQNITWKGLVQMGKQYITLFASDASAPDAEQVSPLDIVYGNAEASVRDHDNANAGDSFLLELIVPPEAIVDKHVLLGNGHSIRAQSSVATAVLTMSIPNDSREDVERIINDRKRSFAVALHASQATRDELGEMSLDTPELREAIISSQQKLPKVSIGIQPSQAANHLALVVKAPEPKKPLPPSNPAPKPALAAQKPKPPSKARQPATAAEMRQEKKPPAQGTKRKAPAPKTKKAAAAAAAAAAATAARKSIPRQAKAKASARMTSENEMSFDGDDNDDDDVTPTPPPPKRSRAAAIAHDDEVRKTLRYGNAAASKGGASKLPDRVKAPPSKKLGKSKNFHEKTLHNKMSKAVLVDSSPGEPPTSPSSLVEEEEEQEDFYAMDVSPGFNNALALVSEDDDDAMGMPISSPEELPARKKMSTSHAKIKAKRGSMRGGNQHNDDEDDDDDVQRHMQEIMANLQRKSKNTSAVSEEIVKLEKRQTERIAHAKKEMRTSSANFTSTIESLRERYSTAVEEIKNRMDKACAYYEQCALTCDERLQKLQDDLSNEIAAAEAQAKKQERIIASGLRACEKKMASDVASLRSRAEDMAKEKKKEVVRGLQQMSKLMLAS
ncbi:hypothetical protein PPROV_000353800 [Pycnococcus provasolii]|uniref:Uncharacterized protein n=2 Tax=Pycnococcus provasolii TaxID=41880 RepID=A0A830HCN5_9CHLO|nr:hypothetical protein PPROV_000353800 [Pycnococcus provasolii]